MLLEPLSSLTEAEALVATLREQGFPGATVVSQEPPVVRAGEPAPLRHAVELAGKLRAAGRQVRLAAQPGEVIALVIRHGTFPSRLDADARAQELARLGLASQVVPVR